jgi:outer membrane receptor protein involved in Fe transport
MNSRVRQIWLTGLAASLLMVSAALNNPRVVFGQGQAEEEAGVLQPITVQAERPDWERVLSLGTVDVIVPDDFKGEQKKLPEYLNMVPGLHVERRGGEGQYSTVTMRGSTSAQVNIYVDGVPQNTGGDTGVDLSLISMNNVARIEVYRGYVPTRFSGAPIGGVINIVTKKPQGLGGVVSVGVKSLKGRQLDATLTGPLFGGSFLLGLHRDQSHGDFKYEYYNNGTSMSRACGGGGGYTGDSTDGEPCTRWRKSNQHQNTDILLKWQDDNWFLRGAWKRTSRYHPNPVSFGGRNAPGLTWNNVPTDTDRGTWYNYQKVDQYDLVAGRRQTWGNLDWGLEVGYMKQNKAYHEMNLYWTPSFFDKNFIRTGQIWNTYDTERYSLALDASYKMGENHLLEFRGDFFDETLTMDGNPGPPYLENMSDSGGYNLGSPVTYQRDTWHAQLSDTITLNERKDLWLTLILRYDKISDSSDSKSYWLREKSYYNGAVTWGVAMKKEIGDTWTIRGSGGSYVRYPNFYELYGDGVYVVPGDAGSPTSPTQREYGHIWDFGIGWRGDLLEARTELSATWFHRRSENLTFPRPDRLNGTIEYLNAGSTQASGVEMEASVRWGGLDLDASATWQRTEYLLKKGGGLDIDEGAALPLMPEWEAHFRATYRLFDDLSLFAEHHYTGRMTENWNRAGVNNWWERESLSVTGFGARYNLPWGLILTAGVDDVFDARVKQRAVDVRPERYRWSLLNSFPSPGRTWYMTLDYSFGGGSDSSGEGSADSRFTAAAASLGMDPDALAADGASPGEPSPFYIAPKLIYSKQSMGFTDRHGELGQGTLDWGLAPRYAGNLPTIPGGKHAYSYFGGALALGVDLHEVNGWPVRMELELGTYRDGKTEKTSLPDKSGLPSGYGVDGGIFEIHSEPTQLYYRSHQVFFNLFVDFHNSSRFTPYIGAGAGISFIKTTLRTQLNMMVAVADEYDYYIADYPIYLADHIEEQRQINLAWNATIGFSYKLSENIELDLSYRYVDSGYNAKTAGRPEEVMGLMTSPWCPGGTPQAPTSCYDATNSFGGVELELRKAHQAVMAMRFSF